MERQDNAGGAGTVPPSGTVRLQFGTRQRLAGPVAWDRASGLLAVELQHAGGGSSSSSNSIPVAIIDPQAPESHFVAHVPAAPGERLAALLWSPPACHRMLLTVTASGRVYSWTMVPEGHTAAQGSSGSGSSSSHVSTHVACVNEWFGRHAFDLPLTAPHAAAAAEGAGSAAIEQQQQQQQQLLLCCRFLEPPGTAGTAWDVAGAPPQTDKPLTPAQVVQHYQQLGLERAFAPAAAPAGSGGQLDTPLPLHWLRPGLLCLAAVTSSGQLLLACRAWGGEVDAEGNAFAGSRGWQLAPAVQLLAAPPLPSGPAGGLTAGAHLLAADVAATTGGALLVAAAAAGQAGLFEVSGPPAPLQLAGNGRGVQAEQRVACQDLPLTAVPPGAATLALSFLPGRGSSGRSAQLAITSCTSSNTSTAMFVCSNAGPRLWQVAQAGAATSLSPVPVQAASAAASQDGSLALLLPGQRELLWLSSSDGGSSGGQAGSRPLLRISLGPLPAAATAPAAASGVAVSPHGCLAAAAVAGSSSLLLLPLLEQPRQASEVDAYALQLGKRCCSALLLGSGGGCWWDLEAAAAALTRTWGHSHLQVTQQLVDAAVLGVRPEARSRYIIVWGRLKAALLAAAAAAHPAAAADLCAAAVRADVAVRDWMAVAADVFEQHLAKPDKATLAAAKAKGGQALSNEMVARVLPLRYWALWCSEFSAYLARCLLQWIRLNQQSSAQRQTAAAAAAAAAAPGSIEGCADGAAAAAAAHQFTADQNALPDCLPCIRLLSDDPTFYRVLGRLITSVSAFTRVVGHWNRPGKATSFTALLQQLQPVQDVAVLLRHLFDAFKRAGGRGGSNGVDKGTSDAGAAAGEEACSGEPVTAGYLGAWTLVSQPPAPALTWSHAAAALKQVQQQQGGSSLLNRIKQLWTQQGLQQGQAETPQSLQHAAAGLGLLPPRATSQAAAARAEHPLAALLEHRQVVLAAAATGDVAAAGALPLPPFPSSWEEWEEWEGGAGSVAAAGAAALAAQHGQQQREQQQQREEEAQWERERDAALGLPPALPAGDDPARYDGYIDVLTGRTLTWEYPVAYVSANGACATAELQPDSLPPPNSSSGPGGGSAAIAGWQAAYVSSSPAGAQPWKRLRVS